MKFYGKILHAKRRILQEQAEDDEFFIHRFVNESNWNDVHFGHVTF